ncbi:carbohydrate binding domain-containing protein [Clostridium intestinale]|uniref:Carbohydrate binding domain-containing protein n=1 Tax=Clostridium intestinale TaxID=36845 RepID=A0A7D6VMT7_9CLOT|nr:carbohydrate binding domain-containing protein [Clostridium intestinale]QLY78026.1 carbohydrate binding domain-containing protein [Clostridium intestinale]
MHKFIKGMTLTLLMTFLATMIPSYNVVAKEKSTDSSVEVQQGTESDGLIVGEITEKREENVKHFMKDDGTFVAMMYNNPVHYKDGSEWKDIDNTLVEKEDAKGLVESKDDILKEATIFSDTVTNEVTTKATEDTANSSSLIKEESVKTDENTSKEKAVLVESNEVKTDSKSTEKAAKDKEINKGKNNKVLENKSNDFKISIAQNINADKLVSINKDKYEVSWNIKSDKNVKVNKKETTDEDVNKLLGLTKEQENKLSKKEKAELENSKKATLIKTTSSVAFEEVKPNINLEYKLISDSIKESIIINKPTDINKFSFNFNMKNLKPELKDNQIILSDKDTGKEIMRMQAPFMVDAKGEQTDRVKLSFDKKEKGHVLTLELDKEWLNSKDRQYPIIVDPSFESSVVSSDIKDTFVAANDTEDKSTNMFLRVGSTPQIGPTRTFIRFTKLPQLTMGDMIIDAKLTLLKEPNQSGTDGQIDVHKVINDWNNVGLKWSTQPAIDWTIKDYQNYANDNWQYWDITDIAKEWYTTGNNYGLCVKKNYELSGHSTYYSSDTSNSIGYPRVYFSYVNNSGLQSYWTYHSQSVGRAGTTNINDYNGNVIHVHDDVSMSGNRLPTVIKHVYNSNDRGEDIGFGLGWRLNLSQEIIYKQIGSKRYYQYIDEDGTRRYFEDTGTEMKEEYGGELTLIKNSNGTFTIRDKDNNSLLFNSRYLEEIIDSNGNKIDLQYNNGRLKSVVDGAGRITRLEYNASNILQEIYYPDNTRVRFDYSGNVMKWITYADGKQSIYDYDGQNNLTSVTNIDGYKMNYEYYSQSPNRIKKLTEGNTDGTLGSSMSYEYSYNSTKFTDNKGRVNYYQFDNFGKTISIRDAAGYAQAYQYGDGTNVNKMTLASKLQKTVNNLIGNNSAEYDKDYYFGKDGGSGDSKYSNGFAYLGKRSLMITKTDEVSRQYINQNINLERGRTYTLSAYVKTENITNNKNKGAVIIVHYKDKNGVYQDVRSRYLNGNNEWTRLESTFTLPSDAAENTVILRMAMEEEKGISYFDGLQLEEGNIANRLNLVDNSDMSGGAKIPNDWQDNWYNASTPASDTRINTLDADHPSYLDNSVFKLSGSSDKDTRIYTMLGVNGKAGDTFVISGWAKGAAVAHGDFAIQPVFLSASGNQWEKINFNRDSKSWQYANGVIKAKSDYTDLHVYITYSNNANEALFDGIQVYKEEFGDTYQYDSKGNIISSVDLSKQQTKFEYNGSNDLIKTTDPKGNQFKYEYDSKKNITKATSAENLIYNFEYDSYGNAIKSKISGASLFIESSASYTANGNYISSVSDSLGNTVGYNYDETKGTLTSTTDAKGNVTNYKYDINNVLTSVTKKVDGVDISNSYTYKNDRIDSIGHNGFSYKFIYDTLGRTTGVNVGSQRLITNTYEANGGNLIESTYGNGAKIQTDYDNLDRVVAKKVNGSEIEHYSYNASGNLAILEDKVNNTTYKYNYDSSDRLVNLSDSKGNSYKNEYDANNNVSKQISIINGQKRESSYEFDKDNKLTKFIFNNGNNFIQYTYDEIARNKEKTLNLGNNVTYKTTTQYLSGVNGSASTQVGAISNNGSEIKYTYDKNGNIETIVQSGKKIKYYYNEINELIREDNQISNNTIQYTYDKGGNLISKAEYPYTDGTTVGSYSDLSIGKDLYIDGSFESGSVDLGPRSGTGYNTIVGPVFDGTSKPNTGEKCFFLDGRSGDDYLYFDQTVQVTPGKTYNISFYHKESTVSSQFSDSSYIRLNDGTHVPINAQLQGDKAWRKTEKLWTCPDGISSIQIRVGFRSNDYSWLAIDDIRVTELVNNNLMVDGSFELGLGDIQYQGTGTLGVVGPIFDGNQSPRTGNKCLGFSQSSGDNYGYINNKISVVPGKSYSISYYHKEVSSGTPIKDLSYVKLSNGNKVELGTTLVSDKTWRKTEKIWTCPEGVNSIQIVTGLSSTNFSWMAIDDLQVIELNNNLFEDGSFESGKVNLGPRGGSGYNTIVGPVFDGTSKPNTGEKCFFMDGKSGDDYLYFNQSVAVIPGKKYNISFYHKEAANGSQLSDSSFILLSDGTHVPLDAQLISDKVWRKAEKTWVCPTGITSMQVRVGFRSNDYVWMAVDDIKVIDMEIANPTKVYNYSYDDLNWKDKLTSYNGKNITYDAIGNPLTYDGYTYTWERGRTLTNISGNNKNISYKYDGSGIRTEKNVNGVVSKYTLRGDKVVYEEVTNGSNVDKIYYTYDGSSNLVSMNLNSVEYYYVRNLQGDIIGLIDNTGKEVVTYNYDSWGKLVSIEGSLKDSVGVKNSYRYRGYRYDNETGMYYLQSRYYNPEWGRFINADEAIGQVGNVQGHNMFQYCFNNPVNMDDPSGCWPKLSTILTGIAVVAAAVAVVAIAVASAPALAVVGGVTAGVGIASGIGTVAGIVAISAGVGAVTAKAAEVVSDKLSRKEHTVYKLVNKNTGQTEYVGRTKNPSARQKAHDSEGSKTVGLDFTPIASNLTYFEARGLEQIAMLQYNTKSFLNSVNGISPKNPRIDIYMAAGRQISHYVGNQISNEVLYWTGR